MNRPYDRKRTVDLGGTARSPEDVMALQAMKLEFAEISAKNLTNFTKDIHAFQELKEKTGFYYLCHGPDEGNPNDINALGEVYSYYVFQILELMPLLDMSLLTLHLWMDQRFITPRVVDYKIELLEKFLDKAAQRDITICLENLSENSEDLERPFTKLPSLNLALDLGHAQLLREENTSIDLIKAFPERIKHLHLHDNFGGNTPKQDLHLPLGKGSIDFEKIFACTPKSCSFMNRRPPSTPK